MITYSYGKSKGYELELDYCNVIYPTKDSYELIQFNTTVEFEC